MKKIDILNFITDFRKSPNSIKTYAQLIDHLGSANESTLNQMLTELQQAKVIRETDANGEKSYQVISR
jgi:SOS-response transcriptional repressor LexA